MNELIESVRQAMNAVTTNWVGPEVDKDGFPIKILETNPITDYFNAVARAAILATLEGIRELRDEHVNSIWDLLGVRNRQIFDGEYPTAAEHYEATIDVLIKELKQ